MINDDGDDGDDDGGDDDAMMAATAMSERAIGKESNDGDRR